MASFLVALSERALKRKPAGVAARYSDDAHRHDGLSRTDNRDGQPHLIATTRRSRIDILDPEASVELASGTMDI